MPLMVCIESFHVQEGDHVRTLSAGQYADSGDPAVKSNPEHFAPAEADVPVVGTTRKASRDVEQATRAPGEKSTARKATTGTGKAGSDK